MIYGDDNIHEALEKVAATRAQTEWAESGGGGSRTSRERQLSPPVTRRYPVLMGTSFTAPPSQHHQGLLRISGAITHKVRSKAVTLLERKRRSTGLSPRDVTRLNVLTHGTKSTDSSGKPVIATGPVKARLSSTQQASIKREEPEYFPEEGK